jgi:hypothetical protein
MHPRLTLVACLTLMAACQKAPPAGPHVVTITAAEYSFVSPDTLPAGLTTFKLMNTGKEPHQAVIFGASGHSFEEMEAAIKMEGPIPPWLLFPAGPAIVVGGDSSNATAQVAPGNYLIVCFIPSPDGQPHVAKGMVRRLVVTPAPAGAAVAAEPTADVTIMEADYSFTLSAPLTAGTHTIRIENRGPQVHEVTFEQLAPGKTVADWQKWAAGGMKGEPPTKPVGGFIGPNPGGVGWTMVTLVPGKYLLTCFVPDAKDLKPHVMHGMVQEITVS